MSINDPQTSKPGEPRKHESEERELRSSTVPTEHGSDAPESEEDVLSDPARDDRLGSDWADEGGAVPAGPATDAPAPDGAEDEDPKRTTGAAGERDSEE